MGKFERQRSGVYPYRKRTRKALKERKEIEKEMKEVEAGADKKE
jgi:hypothetical protein